MGTKASLPQLLLISRQPATALGPLSKDAGSRYFLRQASSAREALEHLESGSTIDVVLVDLDPEDGDLLDALRWIEKLRPELPVILLSYAERAPLGIADLGIGARENGRKPVSEERLERLLEDHLAPESWRDEPAATTGADMAEISEELYFVAASPVMRKVRAQAERLAKVDAPILIVGESGSGKEVVAQLIHKFSARAPYKFARVNCAALSPESLESELFGPQPSSLAIAAAPRTGKLELCHKGTLLLDDFTEMPPRLQAKLLCLLQDKQLFTGDNDDVAELDVRILATTSVNLEKALLEKKLREDLYYLLNAFTIEIPPLRERKEELGVLLEHFMRRMARHYGLPPRSFSDNLLVACQGHSWPGNLRELENFVKRYLVMGDEPVVLSDIRPSPNMRLADEEGREQLLEVSGKYDSNSRERRDGLKTLVRSLKDQAEKDAIATTLEKTGWNRKEAARVLRISYRSLLYKIEQYQLTKRLPA